MSPPRDDEGLRDALRLFALLLGLSIEPVSADFVGYLKQPVKLEALFALVRRFCP